MTGDGRLPFGKIGFGTFSGFEDAALGYLDHAELLSPETFSDPRTEDGRKRGEAQRNECLSI